MRRKLASQRQSGATHSAGSLLHSFESVFDLRNGYRQLQSLVHGRGMYLEQLPRRREDGERCGGTISDVVSIVRGISCLCRTSGTLCESDGVEQTKAERQTAPETHTSVLICSQLLAVS